DFGGVLGGRLEQLWVCEDAPDWAERMRWLKEGDVPTLVVGTMGITSPTGHNGVYLLSSTGAVVARHVLETMQVGARPAPANVRALEIVDFSQNGSPEIVALADDCEIYLWRPGLPSG
ncbi:MAG: hypothetical protein ACXVRH_09020, partial [Thermoleophilaceae bacterium]